MGLINNMEGVNASPFLPTQSACTECGGKGTIQGYLRQLERLSIQPKALHTIANVTDHIVSKVPVREDDSFRDSEYASNESRKSGDSAGKNVDQLCCTVL